MSSKSSILFEPFKIKAVEPLPMSSVEQRQQWIKQAHYNVFSLTSEQVTIDLLTDSGTGAMSDTQWGEMLRADESYAGSRNFRELESFAQELTGMDHIIPVHQGRAAEHLLFSALLKEGDLAISNGFFDTTLANAQSLGAKTVNIPCTEAADPFGQGNFKGNINLQALQEILSDETDKVAFVLMTITNNTGGGQPVSLENIQKAAEITHQYGKPFILDACRFAENACFIKQRSDANSQVKDLSIEDIAKRCFAVADAITFSGKKDALANIGGLLCVKSEEIADALKNHMIVVEGFPTYGGLAGYSLAAMTQGLREVLSIDYLNYRLRTVEWMVERLASEDIPVLQPAGGHAVYIESSKFFPNIPREQLPGIALSTELFIRGGIRSCELGTVAFGHRDEDGNHILPTLDLVRLAIPRRVYTEAHMGYVVETIKETFHERESVNGFAFKEEAPVMRHFRSKFEQL